MKTLKEILTEREDTYEEDEDSDEGDGPYVRFHKRSHLDKWAKEGGWKGASHFESDTGVKFHEIKGKWVQVIHGRVFPKDIYSRKLNI